MMVGGGKWSRNGLQADCAQHDTPTGFTALTAIYRAPRASGRPPRGDGQALWRGLHTWGQRVTRVSLGDISKSGAMHPHQLMINPPGTRLLMWQPSSVPQLAAARRHCRAMHPYCSAWPALLTALSVSPIPPKQSVLFQATKLTDVRRMRSAARLPCTARLLVMW